MIWTVMSLGVVLSSMKDCSMDNPQYIYGTKQMATNCARPMNSTPFNRCAGLGRVHARGSHCWRCIRHRASRNPGAGTCQAPGFVLPRTTAHRPEGLHALFQRHRGCISLPCSRGQQLPFTALSLCFTRTWGLGFSTSYSATMSKMPLSQHQCEAICLSTIDGVVGWLGHGG